MSRGTTCTAADTRETAGHPDVGHLLRPGRQPFSLGGWHMIWVLAVLVAYLLGSLWALRSAYALESKIMRAHLTLLWRRGGKMDGNAGTVRGGYQELKKLGVKNGSAG